MSASSPTPLTVGSLFSGIGGLDLGLERAGMQVIWQSEIDPYASRVLAKHWPDVPNLGDVTKVDWSAVERPDVICGGYPCQPFSFAGRRGGTDDPRHLWPYFADALRHLRPRWALLENVPGHLSLGFDRVLADLASLGFDAEWELLPAAAFGAPHLRYRLFVVASLADSEGEHVGTVDAEVGGAPQPLADTAGVNGEWSFGIGNRNGSRCAALADADAVAGATGVARRVFPDPASSRRFSGVDGRGGSDDTWLVEPDVGRVAHGIPSRVDRLRCLGNGVVPQVAEWVGRQIMTAHGEAG